VSAFPNFRPNAEDLVLQILVRWPKDEYLDEEALRVQVGCPMNTLQRILLNLMDKGILRMEGFKFRRAQ